MHFKNYGEARCDGTCLLPQLFRKRHEDHKFETSLNRAQDPISEVNYEGKGE
jgi:hypothetical protein